MGLARPGTGTAAAGHCRLPSAAVTLSKLGAPCGAEMVRHVISCCAMTCAYGNTGVRTFSVYAVLSTAARLWAAAVPSGNAGATPRSREGCGRRSNIRSDWRECRARRGNQRGGRCDRRCYPPRHGTQFRLLLLTSACKVGDRPREEARDEPQAHSCPCCWCSGSLLARRSHRSRRKPRQLRHRQPRQRRQIRRQPLPRLKSLPGVGCRSCSLFGPARRR